MISILVPSLEKKGPIIVAINLANEFIYKYDTVYVFFLNSSKSEVYIKDDVNVYKLSVSNVSILLKSNVLHSHGFIPDLMVCFLSKVCFNKKINYVSTIHNFMSLDFKVNYPKHKAFILNLFWPILLKKRNVIFISESQKKFLCEKYKFKGKSDVIYNSVVTNIVIEENDSLTEWIDSKHKNGCIVIGTCSVLTKLKSVNTVINALKLLSEDYLLMIIGDGVEMESLKILVNELGLNNRVIFTGFIKNPSMLMSKFDVYIFPSLTEAFGLSGIEASILDVPVVCSDIETFRELYDDKSTLFFKPGSEVDLKNKVEKSCDLITDSALYLSKFSPESVANKHYNFYREMIKD